MRWVWGTPLRLDTENYVLLSVDANNIPTEMENWFADPEVMRFMNDPMHMNEEALKKRFSRFDNKQLFALITDFDLRPEIAVLQI